MTNKRKLVTSQKGKQELSSANINDFKMESNSSHCKDTIQIDDGQQPNASIPLNEKQKSAKGKIVTLALPRHPWN